LPATQTLDAAIAKLAALPPKEQDRVGRWLLDERVGGRATDLDSEKL